MKRIFICVACVVTLLFGVAVAEEATIVASGESGLCAWEINSVGTLTISGDGMMTEYSNYSSIPWYNYRQSIKTIIINNGVTCVCDNAFYGCSNAIDITIADSVKSIGEYAFYDCNSLQNIDLPSEITRIEACLFGHCSSMKSIDIPKNVDYIDDSAFAGCENLINIIIPDGVSYIGGNAFEFCTNLKSISIPDSVIEIGGYAFYQCTAIDTINLSGGITAINEATFFGCDSLKSIVIPDKITSIGKMAFSNSNNITSITFLGTNMPSLGEDALPYTFTFLPRRSTIYCYEGSEIDDWATEEGYSVKYIEGHKHSTTIDHAVPATHVTTGLTEGSHCSECGEILVEQNVIPMIDVKKIVLPTGLKTIEEEAFAGDTFVCVVLPENCSTIGTGAFRNCAQMRFVEIPASVASIDDTAFDGCADDLIIVTASGSGAERFAKEHNIECVLYE